MTNTCTIWVNSLLYQVLLLSSLLVCIQGFCRGSNENNWMGIEIDRSVWPTNSLGDGLNGTVIDTKVVLFQRQYKSGGEVELEIMLVRSLCVRNSEWSRPETLLVVNISFIIMFHFMCIEPSMSHLNYCGSLCSKISIKLLQNHYLGL